MMILKPDSFWSLTWQPFSHNAAAAAAAAAADDDDDDDL